MILFGNGCSALLNCRIRWVYWTSFVEYYLEYNYYNSTRISIKLHAYMSVSASHFIVFTTLSFHPLRKTLLENGKSFPLFLCYTPLLHSIINKMDYIFKNVILHWKFESQITSYKWGVFYISLNTAISRNSFLKILL